MDFPQHLTVADVLRYLGGSVSKRHLENLRRRGDGPAFVKIGRRNVIYPRTKLDDWLAEREFSTTAEARGECERRPSLSTTD